MSVTNLAAVAITRMMADHVGELLRALTDFDPVAARKVVAHTWTQDETAEILAMLMCELDLAADESSPIRSGYETTVEFRFDD